MSRKPYVLNVDDDPDINAILRLRLEKLNCETKSVLNAPDFIHELKARMPDLCLVDLNLGDARVGFKLVEAIRSVYGSKPPIIIMSSRSDSEAIAHAIEVGADDYIIKSANREEFEEKVLKLLRPTKSEEKIPFKVPESESEIKLGFEMGIKSIDEFGISLIGNKLITRGVSFYVGSQILVEITGKPTILVTSLRSWVSDDGKTFGVYAEFDPSDDKLLSSVRSWIAKSETNPSAEQSK